MEKAKSQPSTDPDRPKTSPWARWWRDAIMAVLPAACENAVPASDPEVRSLCVALWQDIVDWAVESGIEGPLRLFCAEASGRVDPNNVLHPCQDAVWGFVPASDLLLIVGEGIVGITCEGVMTDGPPGYERETFDEAMQRLNDVLNDDEDDDPDAAPKKPPAVDADAFDPEAPAEDAADKADKEDKEDKADKEAIDLDSDSEDDEKEGSPKKPRIILPKKTGKIVLPKAGAIKPGKIILPKAAAKKEEPVDDTPAGRWKAAIKKAEDAKAK